MAPENVGLSSEETEVADNTAEILAAYIRGMVAWRRTHSSLGHWPWDIAASGQDIQVCWAWNYNRTRSWTSTSLDWLDLARLDLDIAEACHY